jgi:hypothetical protein
MLLFLFRSIILTKKFAILFAIWETVLAFKRKEKRRKMFILARERAFSTGKKLLVIGDPKTGFFNSITGPDYDYGDVCVDISGCKESPRSCTVFPESIETVLEKLESKDDYIIFQSCVFEYLSKSAYTTVSRSLETLDCKDLFFVQVEWYSLAAYLYLPALRNNKDSPKRIFVKYPPKDPFVYAFDNPLEKWNKQVFLILFAYMVYRVIF